MLTPYHDITFYVDDNQLHEWSAYKLQPFVKWVIVDVILHYVKYVVENPIMLKRGGSIGVFTVVNQSLMRQINQLYVELELMDDTCYNDAVLSALDVYEKFLKYDYELLTTLLVTMCDVVLEIIHRPYRLSTLLYNNAPYIKNVYTHRFNGGVMFKVICNKGDNV